MLAITGGKGGSGKTTTALGLAVQLGKRRSEPIVVDTDVDMPNLHIRADADDTGLDRLAAGESVEDAACPSSRFPAIDVIGARPGAPLERALRALTTDRPVILDGAAGASARAVTPLQYADSAVTVTRDTPASITDTVKTIKMARAVGTPVIATVVSRASDVSEPIANSIDVEEISAIPTVDEPERHPRARAAYSQIIDNWINA
jgi:septum site-determining protein MinD